jgi:hypothetical protein
VTGLDSLRMLRDVPGVVGSCLLDADARVLVRDLPAQIPDELVSGVGRRADAALTAVSGSLYGTAGVVLRFARLAVFCGRAGTNVLLVLCAPQTSTTSVKVAMQVAGPPLSRLTQPVPAPAPPPAAEPSRRRGEGIWG